jgi:oligopeptide/dipeptide ABC transporter ATP-binding protein
MLFISHDLGVVSYIADRIAVMFGGRIIEMLGPGQTLDTARHPYTRALHDAIPSLATGLPEPPPRGVPIVSTVQGCPFRGRCPNAGADCEAHDPELVAVAAAHDVACHHPHLSPTGADR